MGRAAMRMFFVCHIYSHAPSAFSPHVHRHNPATQALRPASPRLRPRLTISAECISRFAWRVSQCAPVQCRCHLNRSFAGHPQRRPPSSCCADTLKPFRRNLRVVPSLCGHLVPHAVNHLSVRALQIAFPSSIAIHFVRAPTSTFRSPIVQIQSHHALPFAPSTH